MVQESDLHTLLIYQRTYFEILEKFFTDVTGSSYDDFCLPSEFSVAIRKLGESLKNDPNRSSVSVKSFEALANELGKLYSQDSIECFKSAKNIECCKINLGGSSRFLETQLNAVRKTILISDIVLIPDPVMPWLESEREYEKFTLVNIIQATYFILYLKVLLSQEFDIPMLAWTSTLKNHRYFINNNKLCSFLIMGVRVRAQIVYK